MGEGCVSVARSGRERWETEWESSSVARAPHSPLQLNRYKLPDPNIFPWNVPSFGIYTQPPGGKNKRPTKAHMLPLGCFTGAAAAEVYLQPPIYSKISPNSNPSPTIASHHSSFFPALFATRLTFNSSIIDHRKLQKPFRSTSGLHPYSFKSHINPNVIILPLDLLHQPSTPIVEADHLLW